MPKALKRFHQDRPDARITFTEGTTPTLAPGLLDSTIDLAVITDYPPSLPAADGIELLHLLDDRLHVAMPIGHRLALRPDLVVRPLTAPPTRTVYVATRAADEPCGAVDAFVDALRESI